MNVLYLTNDLFFSSRLTAGAGSSGINIRVVTSPDQLRERLASDSTAAVLVDLEHRAAEPAAILEIVRAALPKPTTIAYGPHVKEALLQAARDAGFDMVLSRGQFNQQIGMLLEQLQNQQPRDSSS